MRRQGMTLLEVMMAVAVFSIVIATIFSLSLGIADAASLQQVRIANHDEARRALITVIPRLRQALNQSINWGELPGDSIDFQMPVDINGNGTPVNMFGAIEFTRIMTIQRDADDANNDGLTLNQLVLLDGDEVRVLANNIADAVAPADAGEDPPPGVGFWAAPVNGGLRVTVQAQGRTRRGQIVTTTLSEFVMPRN